MSRKKISTTIYITPEQSDKLKLLHERTKVPVAVYIREGIDLALRQYGHLLPGQLPLDAAPRAAAQHAAEPTDADDDHGTADLGSHAASHGPGHASGQAAAHASSKK